MSNPVRDYDAYDAAETHRLSKCPICDYCGYPIEDDQLWNFRGCLYHGDCAAELYQDDTLSYIRGWRK